MSRKRSKGDVIEIFGYQKPEKTKTTWPYCDQKTIQNRNLIYKRHVSFREAFHNMSVSMLTIFSLCSCYLLTTFLSMFCFLMSPQSLVDCFFHMLHEHPNLCSLFSCWVPYSGPHKKRKNLHFQWLPVVASLKYSIVFECMIVVMIVYVCVPLLKVPRVLKLLHRTWSI